MKKVGANTLYLGPVFDSVYHGYDTLDYGNVDPRLGTNDDLKYVIEQLRELGIEVALDGVLNHVSKDHPIVQDLAQKGEGSRYQGWIAGYDRTKPGKGGLPFGYEGWAGHYDLVKLDTSLPEVREYLIHHVLQWIDTYDIVGLRLDAADCLDLGFLRELGQRCRDHKPGFFLLGEAVQGDLYPRLIHEGHLDSVTNYEAYKGLWSSCNDGNFHEIGWTLKRLFGPEGKSVGQTLYSFADNHDVDRVASSLKDPAHLYPLYGLLYAMPGVPSVYYGSEYGLGGRRTSTSDSELRPKINPKDLENFGPHKDLPSTLERFAHARLHNRALQKGDYQELEVRAQGIAFLRRVEGHTTVVGINGSNAPMTFEIQTSTLAGANLWDLLEEGKMTQVSGTGKITLEIPPYWTRWLSTQEY